MRHGIEPENEKKGAEDRLLPKEGVESDAKEHEEHPNGRRRARYCGNHTNCYDRSIMTVRDPAKLFPHDYVLRPFLKLIPEKIHPNHITILRMFLTPVVLFVLYQENWGAGILLFLFTAFTDALDGSLARVRRQITEWGTFYDPVADKFLIGSVMILIVLQHVNPLIAYTLLLIEGMLIFGGWYHRRRHAISANIWGKVKMVLQVIAVLFLLIALWLGIDLFIQISHTTFVLAIIFAIVSLLTYSL